MKTIAAFTLVLLSGTALFPAGLRAETIKQDFNSMADLNAFWDISTWGGDNRVHSAQNVSIDNGILVLKLSGSQPGQKPVCAEIGSKRSDFRYGSYRASIKTSKTPGGVVGWFIYRDSPLNEIDVEMLTRENSNLYYTLHHIQENVDSKVYKMSYDPSAAFHEYRFDWYADKVAYFVDGLPTGTLKVSPPDMDAQIMLNHWSGNIAGWGGDAPTQDMFMYVDWMIYSSDYPAPTSIEPLHAARRIARPATLAYDGNAMKVSLLDASLGKGLGTGSEAGAKADPVTLYTIQGRLNASTSYDGR